MKNEASLEEGGKSKEVCGSGGGCRHRFGGGGRRECVGGV